MIAHYGMKFQAGITSHLPLLSFVQGRETVNRRPENQGFNSTPKAMARLMKIVGDSLAFQQLHG
jgi:hypothetical protein